MPPINPLFAKIVEYIFSLDDGVREHILQDLPRWESVTGLSGDNKPERFANMYSARQEFRSVIQYRFRTFVEQSGNIDVMSRYQAATAAYGDWAYVPALYLSCNEIGPGFYLQHGFSSIIYARKVGANFWLNQNVTIGSGRGGAPTIGNNVSVHANAVVIGGITIGSDVKIGAGAVVAESIPAGATVVPQKAKIILK